MNHASSFWEHTVQCHKSVDLHLDCRVLTCCSDACCMFVCCVFFFLHTSRVEIMKDYSAGPCSRGTNVIKWIHYPRRLFLNVLSAFMSFVIFFRDKCRVSEARQSHLSHKSCEGTMRCGRDPSVCVLLTDLSHITISMATRAVAVATASS